MLAAVHGCKIMVVKYLETAGLVACCFLISQISTSNAYKYQQRKGETGRYTYYNATQKSDLHCRYCPNNVTGLFSSEDVNKQYQEKSCVSKNYPWDKLDQEEKSKKLYPVCNRGEIPSCAKPPIPFGGFWKCEESENLDKVPVYTTCQLQCDSGYKKVGEGHIYCNESRKFDPPWTEITCIASTEVPLFAVCAAVAVAVLICMLLMTVYCCKRCPQELKNAFPKINRGLKKQKSTLVSNTIRESVIVLDSVQLTTITNDVQMTNPSKEPLLPQKPTAKREEKRPIENDDYSDYLIHKIGQHTYSRPRPEGSSDFISGRNEQLKQYRQGSSDPKEMQDYHETYSKEFARDPTFCDRKVNIALILELKKLSPSKYCEDILQLVADMRGINSCYRSDPSDHEIDLRIGHIVYYLSQNQGKDYDNILHQLQTVHPDCIFCKSLYGDMAI